MRLFVAVGVPASVREALADAVAPLRATHDELRWTSPDSWHLTLAFLGETSIGARLRAQAALRSATADIGPCEVALTGRLGSFGSRVLWAGVESDDGCLPTLAGRVRDALSQAGLPIDDQPFQGHLTLARARRGRRVPRVATPGHRSGVGIRWRADTVELLSSEPGRRYRAVATWPVGHATRRA